MVGADSELLTLIFPGNKECDLGGVVVRLNAEVEPLAGESGLNVALLGGGFNSVSIDSAKLFGRSDFSVVFGSSRLVLRTH